MTCHETGCDWTNEWSCPWAESDGSSGRAAAEDNPINFHCCCTYRTSEDEACGGGVMPTASPTFTPTMDPTNEPTSATGNARTLLKDF